MNLDFSRSRLPLFQHQKEYAAWLLDRPYALIASEMRTGKSCTVISAAQFLFEQKKIDKVIVITPAPVRDVWADKTLGELAKHLWRGLPACVIDVHARVRGWRHDTDGIPPAEWMEWYISNFEFLRSKTRLAEFITLCGPRTLLVGDESSFLKNHAAAQTEAFMELRRRCGRVWLLNGTPIFHSPLDLFSQGNILHASILNCKYITHFKSRYAIQETIIGPGGKAIGNGHVKRIEGWVNLDDLQKRFAPVTVRRLQKDCVDMPVKLDPVVLTATLGKETWRVYKQMRDETVVWLQTDVATSATAAVKAMRLSQITGGFLGGVEPSNVDIEDGFFESIDLPGSFLDGLKPSEEGQRALIEQSAHFDAVANIEIGREKLDVLLWFIDEQLQADEKFKLVTWSRFRAEALRAERDVKARFPQFETGLVIGSQKRDDRLRSLALLKPETSPDKPVFVAGVEGTGSYGLDMTAAHTCVTLSSGYSPGRMAQTLDRVVGPAQKHHVAYFNILAVGPQGQQTIDHKIEEARRAGQNVASWTSAHWVKALTEE